MSTRSSELPIPEYDRLGVGDLEHRIRSLPAGDLGRLLTYEREHAARAGVLELLESRLKQVEAGSDLSHGGEPPGAPPDHRRGPRVSPATQGAPVHPPPHGEPGQPGHPKGDQRH